MNQKLNLTNKSVLIRSQFVKKSNNLNEWLFKSSSEYSKYLDRDDAKEYFLSYSNYFDERKGSLGLKNLEHQPLNPNDTPKIHPNSPVWETVISFDKNLSLQVKPEYFQKVINIFATTLFNNRKYKFDVDKIHFEYAIHVNTPHTHAHLKWYFKDEYQVEKYSKRNKKHYSITKKVKNSDIRTQGKLSQEFLKSVKLKIHQNLNSQIMNQKFNYQEKLNLLKLFKIRAKDEILKEKAMNQYVGLLKSFYDSVPKSFRYQYLNNKQKQIIDKICETLIFRDYELNESLKKFETQLKKHFEKVITESELNIEKNVVVIENEVKKEIDKVNVDLKNIILKIIKSNSKEVENLKAELINLGIDFNHTDLKLKKMSKNYSKIKKQANKILRNFFVNNHVNLKRISYVVQQELDKIAESIQSHEEIRGV